MQFVKPDSYVVAHTFLPLTTFAFPSLLGTLFLPNRRPTRRPAALGRSWFAGDISGCLVKPI